MGLKLISRNERYPIETEYITGYDIKIETPRTSLAKMPETKNEMIVTLEVPKSEYKNDINVQTIMKWAEMSVNEQDYFRDIAVHFTTDEGINERSIVFTHAKITLEEFGNVKSDFIEITITINQRRDKFTGVMFGINLDDTYERAWYRANNPPTVNIVVPPDVKDDGIDYATLDKVQLIKLDENNLPLRANGKVNAEIDDFSEFDILFNEGDKGLINNDKKVLFTRPEKAHLFYYSDGPEQIDTNNFKTQFLLYHEDFLPVNEEVDFEFYHKNLTGKKLIVGIMVKNCTINKSLPPKNVSRISGFQDFMNINNNIFEDEKEKEEMCAKVEMNFMNNVNSSYKSLKSGESKFISYIAVDNSTRFYGRMRLKCDNNEILASVVVTEYSEELKNKIHNDKDCNDVWNTCLTNEQTPCGTGQFCGVVPYIDINVLITGMQVGEYIMLGSYIRDNYISAKAEYPIPRLSKSNGKSIFLGNFGIKYKITLLATAGQTIKIYPFGHNPAMYADILIKKGVLWENLGSLKRITLNQAQLEEYNKLRASDSTEAKSDKKIKDVTRAARFLNKIESETTWENSDIKVNSVMTYFEFILPGGNCGGVKFKLIN